MELWQLEEGRRIIPAGESYDGADNESIISAVPIMTSNTTPSDEVSASVERSTTFAAYRAFQGRPSLVNWVADVPVPGIAWIMCQFDIPKLINKYGIGVGSSSRDRADLMPQDWTFEGSNNGVDFDVLDTVVGFTDYEGKGFTEYFTFVVSGDDLYTHFKVNITKNVVEGDLIAIGVVDFIEQGV